MMTQAPGGSPAVAVLRELAQGERRVALVPGALAPLLDAGYRALVESGAGEAAGFSDEEYRAQGARVTGRAAAVGEAQVLAGVRGPVSETVTALAAGTVVVGQFSPATDPAMVTALAEGGLCAFSLELLPRITRAQSMDVLSSQATVTGYRAVLLAAARLERFFPKLARVLRHPRGGARQADHGDLVVDNFLTRHGELAVPTGIGSQVDDHRARPHGRYHAGGQHERCPPANSSSAPSARSRVDRGRARRAATRGPRTCRGRGAASGRRGATTPGRARGGCPRRARQDPGADRRGDRSDRRGRTQARSRDRREEALLRPAAEAGPGGALTEQSI